MIVLMIVLMPMVMAAVPLVGMMKRHALKS
jgi:hypothetical protein